MPLPMQIARPGLVLRPGALLASRYVIEAEVGRGGLGIVYRALDRTLGETIAIKMLRPELVATDPGAFERLKAEIRITRRLSHRNVVRTYDIGESEEAPFLTMEYVNGASLSTVIHLRGALAPAAVLSIAKQLLRALAVAHEHGIVHGDIKPQNLLIDASGLLKVTDFGVARLVRGARASASSAPSLPSVEPALHHAPVASRLAGALVGTPEYMAPEQLIGEPSSARTDIYAAGVVLHECMSGVTPYGADTPVAFVARKLAPRDGDVPHPAARPADAEHGGALTLLIDRMRDPRAATRPDSARELLSLLGALG
jgi:serine/threonine protein kinase